MKAQVRRWFHGLIGGIIGGSATAGTTWLAMAGAKSAGLDVPELNWKALGVILVSGAVTSALAYLKQSPLPPVEDEPTVSKSVLPLLLIGALCISAPTFTGCATTRPATVSKVAFRTLETSQVVVDKAMVVYGDMCARGKVSIDDQKKIDAIHAAYRDSFRIAVISASFNYKSLTPDTVQGFVDSLISAISKL